MILAYVLSADSSKSNSVIPIECIGPDLYQNSAYILIMFNVYLDQLPHLLAK